MPFRHETWKHEWARKIYILVVIASALAMAILFLLIVDDRDSIRREANIRANQIQQQRYDTTFSNCVDQNTRNKKTIYHLHQIFTTYAKLHPEARQMVKQAFEQNKLLINSIVPRRNCRAVAKRAVHPLVNPITGRGTTTTGG